LKYRISRRRLQKKIKKELDFSACFISTAAKQMKKLGNSEGLTPAQFTRAIHPRNSPAQFTRAIHPRNSPAQFTRAIHPRNSPAQ